MDACGGRAWRSVNSRGGRLKDGFHFTLLSSLQRPVAFWGVNEDLLQSVSDQHKKVEKRRSQQQEEEEV